MYRMERFHRKARTETKAKFYSLSKGRKGLRLKGISPE
jgi:hypothetical protein